MMADKAVASVCLQHLHSNDEYDLGFWCHAQRYPAKRPEQDLVPWQTHPDKSYTHGYQPVSKDQPQDMKLPSTIRWLYQPNPVCPLSSKCSTTRQEWDMIRQFMRPTTYRQTNIISTTTNTWSYVPSPPWKIRRNILTPICQRHMLCSH